MHDTNKLPDIARYSEQLLGDLYKHFDSKQMLTAEEENFLERIIYTLEDYYDWQFFR